MLVSVHLPKTAGSSFAALLAQYFGDTLRLDYADTPLHYSRKAVCWRAWRHTLTAGRKVSRGGHVLAQDNMACIHGHFLPFKYRYLMPEAQFVTWMRDPVTRLRSHYDFWRREYNPDTAGRLHRQMMAQDWSFERFALGPELRNIYARFLWRFPLSEFAFVGVFEHLEEDTAYFIERVLDERRDTEVSSAEKMPEKMPEKMRSGIGAEPESARLAAKIYRWHSVDAALYQQACTLRVKRVASMAASVRQ